MSKSNGLSVQHTDTPLTMVDASIYGLGFPTQTKQNKTSTSGK